MLSQHHPNSGLTEQFLSVHNFYPVSKHSNTNPAFTFLQGKHRLCYTINSVICCWHNVLTVLIRASLTEALSPFFAGEIEFFNKEERELSSFFLVNNPIYSYSGNIYSYFQTRICQSLNPYRTFFIPKLRAHVPG